MLWQLDIRHDRCCTKKFYYLIALLYLYFCPITVIIMHLNVITNYQLPVEMSLMFISMFLAFWICYALTCIVPRIIARVYRLVNTVVW